MRILLDFDSTTADLDKHMRDSVNARFGTDYQAEEITSWEWWDTRPPEQGAYVWGDECFQSVTWTMDIPPIAGAIDGVQELLDEGHELFVVSDRAPHMGLWLSSWLAMHGLTLPVFTTSRKGPTKLDMIRELELEVVIEDAPHHARDMAASGLVQAVMLLDKPWNHDVVHRRVIRCFGWEHLLYGHHLLYVGR